MGLLHQPRSRLMDVSILFLVTLLIAGEVSLAAKHYTHNGKPCIGKCAMVGRFYSCYIEKIDNWEKHEYCSGRMGYDIKDRKCNGGCDNEGGTSYTWCWVSSSWGWDYCGIVEPDGRYYEPDDRDKYQYDD